MCGWETLRLFKNLHDHSALKLFLLQNDHQPSCVQILIPMHFQFFFFLVMKEYTTIFVKCKRAKCMDDLICHIRIWLSNICVSVCRESPCIWFKLLNYMTGNLTNTLNKPTHARSILRFWGKFKNSVHVSYTNQNNKMDENS